MKHASPFVISEFTNPSGDIVFQLYARIDGKRFRKNFPTRVEAETERQVQEVQQLQRETGIRAAATRLTDEQSPAFWPTPAAILSNQHPLG
ncbi:MAG TPA: hypothetical protein VNV15_05020 [Opitutaceae bacterium]|jgi:hypothetical protein|nr:hypothetical protein [Opitutaceae bacterium]